MAEFEVIIDDKRCKGCSICVEACNKDCLVITENYNQAGYFYPEMKPEADCTGCGACVKLCPDYAVSVYEILDKAG